ncbi:hypothetical protein CSKR_100432 [Clonorchis sinensis]|uniref:Uncharacterized protein n=1 Tax=Clonorchis sinensis TaxID=79923 RepID=A0A8T1N1W0_CLOSI|nr:hypothetical protein CSKR_100432 [Clonorchis sinensis]
MSFNATHNTAGRPAVTMLSDIGGKFSPLFLTTKLQYILCELFSGDTGINETFDVHTYGEYVVPCEFRQSYPWDVLAKGIMFKRKEEEIILRPVQLIIIGRKNPIAPAPVAPIIMSEVQAFGTMLHEALAPQMPPEEPFPVSHYELQHILCELFSGDTGINETFDVHTYGEYVVPCEFRQSYPWDVLAKGIMFKRKEEEIILRPVQLIIIGRKNPIAPAPVAPIIMSDVQAFGTMLHEALAPQMPPEEPFPVSHYEETRKAIVGSQKTLYVEPKRVEWRPRADHKDVVLGIVQNRVVAMAVKRQSGRLIVINGQVIDQLPNSTTYNELCQSFRQWLTNGQNHYADFVPIGSVYKPGDIILIKRTNKFGFEKVYSHLTSGENSAVAGYFFQNGEDNPKQLLSRLEIEHAENGYRTSEQSIDLQSMIPTLRFTPLDYELHQITSPYPKNPHTATALYNYNVILLQQTGETCTRLPGVQSNYLDVPPTMRPTTITTTIRAPWGATFFLTTTYAKPGHGFPWTILTSEFPEPAYSCKSANGWN